MTPLDYLLMGRIMKASGLDYMAEIVAMERSYDSQRANKVWYAVQALPEYKKHQGDAMWAKIAWFKSRGVR